MMIIHVGKESIYNAGNVVNMSIKSSCKKEAGTKGIYSGAGGYTLYLVLSGNYDGKVLLLREQVLPELMQYKEHSDLWGHYENGNNYIAQIFCREFSMSIDDQLDGIYFNLIKLRLDNIIYELLWHEDTGNAIYSIGQNQDVVDILEQRLHVVLKSLNVKIKQGSIK